MGLIWTVVLRREGNCLPGHLARCFLLVSFASRSVLDDLAYPFVEDMRILVLQGSLYVGDSLGRVLKVNAMYAWLLGSIHFLSFHLFVRIVFRTRIR